MDTRCGTVRCVVVESVIIVGAASANCLRVEVDRVYGVSTGLMVKVKVTIESQPLPDFVRRKVS